MTTLEIVLLCLFIVLFSVTLVFTMLTVKKTTKLNKENKKITAFLNAKTNYFTNFEKIWLICLITIAVIISIVLPEDSVNGIDGRLITILYLLDIIFAMICELLISKQSKWNAIIYLLVEAVELITLILLKARIASLAIIVVFWIPMHILTFVNWHKHLDNKDKQVTIVRQLKWWQSLVLFAIIAVWTAGFGYVIAVYGPETEFFASDTIMKVVAYLDACFSILGVIDGVLVWLRFKESSYIWIVATFIETIINIITGQWVLLILKVGYLTNCFYGLFKWTRYIKIQTNQNNNKKTVLENI